MMIGAGGVKEWLNSSAGKAVVVVAVIVTIVGAISIAEATGDRIFYQITWKARGVSAEIQVNGAPVSSDDFEFDGVGSAPANIWLKPEKNSIFVRVKSLPQYKNDDAFYSLAVTKAKAGQYSDEGNKIFTYDWKAGTSKEVLPLEKRFALNPQPPVVLELWTKAEALGLNSRTEKEAREFLKIVSDAYVKSDVDKVWTLTEFKNMEYMRALSDQPKSPAEMKKELKTFFEMLKKQRAAFAPIDTTAVRFTLVAEKRLIMCRTRNGKDVLVARSGYGVEYVTPLYLARVGGRWVVAR